MAEFVPGAELWRGFYEEVVSPLLAGVTHSAALLGWGSDVLGFDDERSTDHGWGPRLTIFVEPGATTSIEAELEARLPAEYGGWPVRYGWDDMPLSHHVDVATLSGWLTARLGFDPCQDVTHRDWLSTPQQLLLEVTAGAVYHDGLGRLVRARELLSWYPHDVWLWLLACQWRRLDQEEPFVGRAAEVADELGSRVIAARLVRDVMRLCFLLERRYAPYSKWLGSAFRRLDASRSLHTPLLAALTAAEYTACEAALVEALERVAELQNELGITGSVDPQARLFHSRPFCVIGSHRFVEACLAEVADPWLRSLPLIGGVDQFVDSTDVLSDSVRARATLAAYERS
jgi:Domain of unknown function (DUF4037)